VKGMAHFVDHDLPQPVLKPGVAAKRFFFPRT